VVVERVVMKLMKPMLGHAQVERVVVMEVGAVGLVVMEVGAVKSTKPTLEHAQVERDSGNGGGEVNETNAGARTGGRRLLKWRRCTHVGACDRALGHENHGGPEPDIEHGRADTLVKPSALGKGNTSQKPDLST
jgi:hypothetical protein